MMVAAHVGGWVGPACRVGMTTTLSSHPMSVTQYYFNYMIGYNIYLVWP